MPICSQVAPFHGTLLSRTKTLTHSAASVRVMPARITRHPRSTSWIRAVGRGSARRQSSTRGAQRTAMSGTKNIMKEIAVS